MNGPDPEQIAPKAAAEQPRDSEAGPSGSDSGTFEKLYEQECRYFGNELSPDEPKPSVQSPCDTGEPYVKITPYARVGLALSGGGIRSATFALGLLQGLNDLKLLRQIDYLSTVSGGGYIGAFWKAWLNEWHCRPCNVLLGNYLDSLSRARRVARGSCMSW